jgi:membrane-anchored mycosin MYCP
VPTVSVRRPAAVPTVSVRRAAAVLAVGLMGASLAVAPAGVAVAAPGCAKPNGVYTNAAPWQQRLLDPARVWPLSNGTGVTVAVLGTGVDAANPQFSKSQVTAGTDVSGAGATTIPATTDCDGRGTFAAGIVGAQPSEATTFAGMAPGVKLLPIRYTQATDQGANAADPVRLAAAIRSAVTAGARVICVVVPATVDNPALRDAVTQALAADAVVVSAAVGQPNAGGRSYPTADPRVLSVAAIAQDGSVVSTEEGDYIDLSAPGKGLVSLGAGTSQPGHAYPVDDAGQAAAFVAGAVALVRAYRPGLRANEVVSRIQRTASGTPVGGRSDRLGYGVVNPYAAVTAEGIDAPSASPARNAAPAPVAGAQPPRQTARDRTAVAFAGISLLLGILLASGAYVLRRGRSRAWRPGLRKP